MALGVGRISDPLPRPLAALALGGFVRLDDAREAVRPLGRQGADHDHPPAPHRVARDAENPGEFPTRAGRVAHHVAESAHEEVGTVDAADRGAGEPRPRASAPPAAPTLRAGPGLAVSDLVRPAAARASPVRGREVDLDGGFSPVARVSQGPFGGRDLRRRQPSDQLEKLVQLTASLAHSDRRCCRTPAPGMLAPSAGGATLRG